MAVQPAQDVRDTTDVRVTLVDADVHPFLKIEECAEYLAEPWRTRYFARYADEVHALAAVNNPPHVKQVIRADAAPPSGGPPGSDPVFLHKQLLQETAIDYAILNFLSPRSKINTSSLRGPLASSRYRSDAPSPSVRPTLSLPPMSFRAGERLMGWTD